jgi:3-deoxy-manno-octulosonate cytidylyltransferase (CMP-KDO synthetase)
MIVRVAQRVRSGVPEATRVVVAADDEAILAACLHHDIEAVLTSKDHPSGSDRLAQACDLLNLSDDQVVVNVQGDEPLIDPQLVNAVAQLLDQHAQASMSTAAHPLHDVAEFLNPNVVKVALDAQNMALYFSRAPIPHWRDQPTPATLPQPLPLRHIGIYGYRVKFLRQFPKLSQSPLEVTESLEQLRAMWHGYRIAVHITPNTPGPGVDTPQELERVRQFLGV